jgi:hypothetical protein
MPGSIPVPNFGSFESKKNRGSQMGGDQIFLFMLVQISDTLCLYFLISSFLPGAIYMRRLNHLNMSSKQAIYEQIDTFEMLS